MMKKILFFILVLSMICMMFGCKESTSFPETTSSATTPSVDVSSEQKQDEDSSLVCFRQSMMGTSNLFGAAYLGTIPEGNTVDITVFLQSSCPYLCEELPFITKIAEKQIIGTHYGEVYCLVPLDEKAVVSVHKGVENSDGSVEYTQELYHSQSGEPILVFANNGGFSPDTQITLTTDSGNGVTWLPQMGNNDLLETENGTCNDSLMKDFSPYSQILWGKYRQMKDEGWKMPKSEQLVGLTFHQKEYLMDGNVRWYSVTFHDKTVDIEWDNDGETHEYKGASWKLTYEEEVALITFDFDQFAGEQSCAVLIDGESHNLYTCANVLEDAYQFGDLSASDRIMERIE